MKRLDVVENDTTLSETDEHYSFIYKNDPVNYTGKSWFVSLEMKLPKFELQSTKIQLDMGSTFNTLS